MNKYIFKAHIGIEGNEIADLLAKEACNIDWYILLKSCYKGHSMQE